MPDPTVNPLAVFIAALAGIGGITRSLLFRAGHLRGDARRYWDSSTPWYLRNLPFAGVPLGSSALFLVLTYLVSLAPLRVRFEMLAVLAGILGFLTTALVAVRWMSKPPEWMKPEWLRLKERSHPPPPARPARGFLGVLDRAFIGLFVWTCVLLATVVLLFIVGVLVKA